MRSRSSREHGFAPCLTVPKRGLGRRGQSQTQNRCWCGCLKTTPNKSWGEAETARGRRRTPTKNHKGMNLMIPLPSPKASANTTRLSNGSRGFSDLLRMTHGGRKLLPSGTCSRLCALGGANACPNTHIRTQKPQLYGITTAYPVLTNAQKTGRATRNGHAESHKPALPSGLWRRSHGKGARGYCCNGTRRNTICADAKPTPASGTLTT